MKGNYGKRFLSLMLSAIMVLGMLPVGAFATNEGTVFSIGPCEHHECAAEVCGVADAIPGADCTHEHDPEVCTYDEAEDTCTHEHDEDCGFVEAKPAQSCMYMCAICGVQSLIDALPTEFASEEEVEAFWAKVEKIDEAMAAIDADLLDLTNYDLAVDAAAAFVNPEFDNATTLEGENKGEENVEEIAEGADATELVIDTVEEFKEFAKLSQGDNSFSGKTIKLGADIDFAGENYLEIAEDGTVVTDYRIPKFSGTFDGDGHTIKNFNFVVEAAGKYSIMMFSQDNMWAYIKNLNIENVNVSVADITGETRITALANRVNAGGMTSAAIENVHVKNFKIECENTTSNDLRIGGFAYFVQGSQLIAKDCSIDGFTVTAPSANIVAGAVGIVKSKCDLENVDVKNAVFNVDEVNSLIGGFAGQTQDNGTGTTFTNCDVDVKMTVGNSSADIGGFIAQTGAASQFYNCTTTGSITVTDDTSALSVGGFVGNLGWNGMGAHNTQHEFNGCVADVDITAVNANVGGFIGNSTVAGYPERFIPAYFNDCEAKGDVETVNGAAGGFVGTGDRGIFTDCSASGDVEGRIAGGFWGEIYPKAKAEFSGGWSYDKKEVTHTDAKAKSIVLEGLTVSGAVAGTEYEAGLIGLVDNVYGNADGYVTPIILNNNSINDVNKSGDAVIEIPVELITEIDNLEDLIVFRDLVNAGYDYAGKTVTLNADIDLTGKVWIPIGTSNYNVKPTADNVKMFAGNFDGGNHTITGLSSDGYVPAAEDISSGEYCFGLFGYVYGANISNVKLANVDIDCCTRKDSAGNDVGGSGVAALIGYYVPADGKTSVIDNCHVLSGTVKATNNMGGLIGHMDAQLSQPKVDITISDCSNAADVTTEAREAGGILGLMNSAREGNYYVTMSGTVTFENCVNTGDITSLGGGAPSAGGILGRDHNQAAGQRLKIIFDVCENSGTITVTANGETHAAGIGAGYYSVGAWLIAKDCENTGDVVVNGSGDIYAGGLISYGGVVELIHSTSYGTVTGGNGNKYVGGANHIVFVDKMYDYNDTVVGNTYHLNGGTSPEYAALVDDAAGGGNFHLVETAYKTLYEEDVTFLGWYDNPEFIGNKYETLNKNVKHYYAKWDGPVAMVGTQEYKSLQEAIEAALASSENEVTVYVLDDTAETVKVPTVGEKTLKIVAAEDLEEMPILGGGIHMGIDDNNNDAGIIEISGLAFEYKGVSFVDMAYVKITSCTFNDITNKTDDRAPVAAVYIQADNHTDVQLSGNIIDDVAGAGIRVRSPKVLCIENNKISNTGHNAITIESEMSGYAPDITVTNNTLSDWGQSGEGRAMRIVNNNASKMLIDMNVMSHDDAPEEFVKVTGTPAAGSTVGLNKNYWGGENPVDAGLVDATGILIGNYYADAKLTKLIELAVAKIGDDKYMTLSAAIEAAQAGDTIELLADITLTGKLTIAKAITIDGNGHSIIANHTAFIVETSSDCTFKNITLNTNNKAKGVKIASGNVVFDNVTIPNSNKSDAITVNGTLTLKNYFKAATTYTLIDARSGVVNAEAGTVFDMTNWRANASPATCDLKGAVDTDGNPFFDAYNSTTYIVDLATSTQRSNITLLANVTLTKDETFSGTLNLNGHDLTIAEGKALKVSGNLTITGEGKVDGTITLTTVAATLTAPEGLNVTTNVEGKVVNYANGVYSVGEEKVDLPDVIVTDIKNTLTDSDPDLTFALNFAIKDMDKLTDEYIEALFAAYGDYYVDYVLTIEGLADESVTFNANGNADGYLAGQYDAWSENWVSVPFEDVTVKNGESLYIMEYAAKLMNQSGLRFTLKEVAEIVQNFDCGVYFTPEFLAANPEIKVTLELKVFTEDVEGNKIEDISVAKNVFEFAAAVKTADNQTTCYTTLSDAMDAAKTGDTVILLKAAEIDALIIPADITLDLNGKTLTVNKMFVKFGTMMDSSEDINGLFKLGDSAQAMWGNTNGMYLPVKVDEGYRLATIVSMGVAKQGENKYLFQPVFSAKSYELLAEGKADTGVSIEIHVGWSKTGTETNNGTQIFVFNQEAVDKFINNWIAGKKKMFTLTITKSETLSITDVSAVIDSEPGVVFEKVIY